VRQNPSTGHFTPSPPFDTSKVMVIVWRLRGNIILTVLYIANVLPLQRAQLTKQFIQPGWALSLTFCFFRLHDLSLCVSVCFVLPWTVESFPLMLWRWRNKLK